MTNQKSTPEDGFTLTEILVATMITAVILTVLVASFLVFLNNSSYTSGRDDHAAGAEILASYLDRDLASATAHVDATSLTTCPTGSSQVLESLIWWQYVTPAPSFGSDADPIQGSNAFKYTATYKLEHDDSALATSPTCMITRTYVPGTGPTVVNILIRGLANVGVQTPATTSTCGTGQPLLITLKQYQSSTQSDTSPSYTYKGCLKTRTNGI